MNWFIKQNEYLEFNQRGFLEFFELDIKAIANINFNTTSIQKYHFINKVVYLPFTRIVADFSSGWIKVQHIWFI